MFTDITQLLGKIKKIFYTGKNFSGKVDSQGVKELGYVLKYEDTSEFNIVSLLSNRLANIVCSEASAEIISSDKNNSDNKGGRVDFLNGCLKNCLSELRLITARTFGTGGIILKPYIHNNKIYADIIPQSRFFVIERRGEIITKAGFIADFFVDCENSGNNRGKPVKYIRIEEHTLGDDGSCAIENKAFVITDKNSGNKNPGDFDFMPVKLSKVPGWEKIPRIISISDAGQMLFSVIKCPVDNRKDSGLNNICGVPVTYGQDKLIKMILDLLNEIPDEYRNKKAFIGADDLLFDKDSKLPESGLYKLFRSGGGVDKQSFWEVFSPEIRHTSYFEGLDYLFGLLEKAVSVNKGMLTDLDTTNATATAIKRGTLDTFATVDAMRKNIENAVEKLVGAFNIIADAFDLCEPGKSRQSGNEEYRVKFNWNYSLLEDASETWTQYLQGYHAGAVQLEELRMFIFGEDRKVSESFLDGE
ncbi:MAG: hypothetical protein FWH10_07265 [Oscillospiraceae bacterium]|nr:hypothetical protein [Oscillospiraceae bacterium]